jgi:DNA-binding response OmpR family regulator
VSTRVLDVLVVHPEAPITAAIAAVLRARGHVVSTATSSNQALGCLSPQVLVSDLSLPDGSGFDLLSALHAKGQRPHTVFVSAERGLEECRRAIALGAAELLAKPFRLAEIVEAVESCPDAPSAAQEEERRFVHEYRSCARSVDAAARDLAAFALRCGIAPSSRARIASAASEIVDNARRHAYVRARGTIRVEAELDGRDFVVTVADRGRGFDVGAEPDDSPLATSAYGLSRAAALSEELAIDSTPGEGTSVTLRFSASRVEFDEEAGIDLSELDYLTPDLARRVLHQVRQDDGSASFHLSPALAVVLGRLLSGPDPRTVLQKALWSS